MMRKDAALIRALIERGEEKTSIRGLSEELGMDYKNAYGIVKRLEKEGLISLEKVGNSNVCKLARKPHPLIYEAENERRENLLKDSKINAIYEKLKVLQFPFMALVFGSHAKGEAKKGSDVDLMVICEKGREKGIEDVVSILPFDIHLVPLTPEEFLSMAKSREFSVVSEAIKRNVILIGIEEYYRLMQDAG